MRLQALVRTEIRRFFSLPWNLRLAALLVPAIWWSLLENMPSPFVPIFAILFIGLEPHYCNIFYHTPNEFEAMCVLPVPWTSVILAKNLSTILITLFCLPIVSILVLFFSADMVPAVEFARAGLYLSSIIFPLIHAGNLQSLLHPRRHLGWRMDDLAGGVLMAGFVAVLSIPYLLLVEVADIPLLCVAYSGTTGYIWYRYSLSETARRAIQSASTLCAAR